MYWFRFPSLVLMTLLLAYAATSFSPGPELDRFEFSEIHMGTRVRLVLYTQDRAAAAKASQAAFRRIAQLDDSMSDYRPMSELMRLSRQAGSGPVEVSEDLFGVLQQSQEMARRTQGAFDVTLGPVVRLWRRARRRGELPDPARLTQTRGRVGYEKLRLDLKTRTAQLMMKGMLLDLGGIAKGYVADQALAVLKQHGFPRALVDAGGDVVVGLPPPGRAGWRVGVAALGSDGKRYLMLRASAVSTSGDAEQFVEIGGKRYSHIVDPRTGVGLIGSGSVTVMAPTGTLSDSLATAVSVLGPEKGMALIDSIAGTGVLMMQSTEDGIHTFEHNFGNETQNLPGGE